MAEIHRYDSARLQRPRHLDVGQRTLHSQPAGAHLHSARHTMREAAAEESQRPSSDYAGGHCAHRDATQKKQNRLRSVTYKTICLIPTGLLGEPVEGHTIIMSHSLCKDCIS